MLRGTYLGKRPTADFWRITDAKEEETAKDTVKKKRIGRTGITFCNRI